jgi:hypothetical protein
MDQNPFLLNPDHRAVLDGDRTALDVQKSGGRLVVGLIGTAVFGLLVLGMAGVLSRYLVTEARLRANGVITEAEVLEHGAFIDPDDPDDITDARWWIVYRFEAGGEAYQREQDIRPATYEATEGLAVVPVRYLPANPELARVAVPAEEQFNTGGVVALSAGMLAFGGIGAIFARQVVVARRQPRALRAAGQPLDGQLRRARGFGETPDTYRVAMVGAFVSPKTGDRITVTAEAPRPDLYGAELPPSGTPIVIWYASDELYQVL